MNNTKLVMNNPVYLGLMNFDISKVAMHEYWYNYAKVKTSMKRRQNYATRIRAESFIAYIKSEDVYADLA